MMLNMPQRARGVPVAVPAPGPLAAETALIGDSNTDKNLGYNNSPVFWMNGLLGGGLKVIHNAGVAGDKVQDVRDRISNAATASPPGLAGLPPLGMALEGTGTNDAREGTPIASLAPVMAGLYNDLRPSAQWVVLLSLPSIGPSESGYAAKNAHILDYNAYRQAFAAANSSWCRYIDVDVNTRDGSGAQLPGLFNSDGIHKSGPCIHLEGVDGAADSWFASQVATLPSPVSSDAADVYPAQPQWNSNHVMAGTGGSVGSGWTGQVANGYSIGSNGSGIGGTLSKVAADGGDSNATPWQRIAPTSVARTGAGESIRITTTLSGRTVTTSDPSTLDMVVELRFNSFDTNYFSVFRLWVQGNTGAAVSVDLDLKMGGEIITHDSVVLRIALPRPTAVAQSSLTLYWDCLISANKTGSMGSFDFRCLTVRG